MFGQGDGSFQVLAAGRKCQDSSQIVLLALHLPLSVSQRLLGEQGLDTLSKADLSSKL